MKIRTEFGKTIEGGLTLFPALYFGRSDRAWWLYAVFLKYRCGFQVDNYAH